MLHVQAALCSSRVDAKWLKGRLALACTCRSWRSALSHPGYWSAFFLPAAVNCETYLKLLNAHSQRLQRTTRLLVAVPKCKLGMMVLTRLIELAPNVCELEMVSTSVVDGSEILDAISRTAGPRLHVLRLGRLRINDTAAQLFKVDDSHRGSVHGFKALRQLEMLNLPTERFVQQKEGADASIIFRSHEDVARSITRGCADLESFTLHNPDAPNLRCSIDIGLSRAGVSAIVSRAYHALRKTLPPVPKYDMTRNSSFEPPRW